MSLNVPKREWRRRWRELRRQLPPGLIFAASLLLVAGLYLMLRPAAPAKPPTTEVAVAEPDFVVHRLETLPPESEAADPTDPSGLAWREGSFDPKKPFYYQLTDLGVSPGLIHRAIKAFSPVFDFRKAQPRHRWRIGFRDDAPAQMTLAVSPVEIYDLYELNNEEPRVEQRVVETFTDMAVVRGQLEHSLFQSLAHEPQSVRLAAKMEEVFAWDIDFYQDPRVGDTFDLLVEKEFLVTEEGPVFHDYGRILAARYFGREGVREGYYFESEPGKGGYYNAAGESLIRDVLRSPLKLQRITSSYNPRRFHPILKKRRPHNGVDYGANKGTPVMAVADGAVTIAGWYGGAGRAVVLRHKNQLETQYFHLSRLGKNVRKGARVKQGQIIGYVGKTGLATSYHLHFGMKIQGRYVNPLKQKFRKGAPLPKEKMDSFQQWVDHFRNDLTPAEPQSPLRVVDAFPLFHDKGASARASASGR